MKYIAFPGIQHSLAIVFSQHGKDRQRKNKSFMVTGSNELAPLKINKVHCLVSCCLSQRVA